MTTMPTRPTIPAFDRHFFDGTEQFTCIGSGAYGGKAHGLLTVKDLLGLGPRGGRGQRTDRRTSSADFDVQVPTLTVVTTDRFEAFMAENRLWDVVHAGEPDHRIATAFQAGESVR